MSFSDWSWEQCMVKGHEIVSIKDSDGENIKWVNTTTGEEFFIYKESK